MTEATKDIFISYAREDRALIETLQDAIAQQGWTLWVDRYGIQEGTHFDEQIEVAIAACTIVLVIWSRQSIGSSWVRAEADYALAQNKLIPLLIDDCQVPLRFRNVHVLDFRTWDGAIGHPDFLRLKESIARRLRDGLVVDPRNNTDVNKGTRERLWRNLTSFGLAFENRHKERQFLEYLRRDFWSGQLAIGICAAAWTAGRYMSFDDPTDPHRQSLLMNTVDLLPFLPLAASFTSAAKKHYQAFFVVFPLLGTLLLFFTEIENAHRQWFHPFFNLVVYMFYISMGILLPLRFGILLPLSAIVCSVAVVNIAGTAATVGLAVEQIVLIVLLTFGLICAAYNRERRIRELISRTI